MSHQVGDAVRFTPHGVVRVSVRKVGAWVEIAVTDTGIEIASDVERRVFVEFQQADPSATRTFSGSNFGLAIPRRLVESHGGTIAVESDLGVDSTFTVGLRVGE